MENDGDSRQIHRGPALMVGSGDVTNVQNSAEAVTRRAKMCTSQNSVLTNFLFGELPYAGSLFEFTF